MTIESSLHRVIDSLLSNQPTVQRVNEQILSYAAGAAAGATFVVFSALVPE
jgi:hypothetical protein